MPTTVASSDSVPISFSRTWIVKGAAYTAGSRDHFDHRTENTITAEIGSRVDQLLRSLTSYLTPRELPPLA